MVKLGWKASLGRDRPTTYTAGAASLRPPTEPATESYYAAQHNRGCVPVDSPVMTFKELLGPQLKSMVAESDLTWWAHQHSGALCS